MLKKILLVAAVTSILPALIVKPATDIPDTATTDIKVSHHFIDKVSASSSDSEETINDVLMGNQYDITVKNTKPFVAAFKDGALKSDIVVGTNHLVSDYSDTKFDIYYANGNDSNLVIAVDSSNHFLGYAAVADNETISSETIEGWKGKVLSPFGFDNFVDQSGNAFSDASSITENMIVRPGALNKGTLPTYDVSVFGSTAYIG